MGMLPPNPDGLESAKPDLQSRFNPDGLETAKPDLQSRFKKPGGATAGPRLGETLRDELAGS
jgi:hypothetical protein